MSNTPTAQIIMIRLTHVSLWESMGKPCGCVQFVLQKLRKACFLDIPPKKQEWQSRVEINIIPLRISLALLCSKRSSVELPLRAGLIRAG